MIIVTRIGVLSLDLHQYTIVYIDTDCNDVAYWWRSSYTNYDM